MIINKIKMLPFKKKYYCPCCGYDTLRSKPPGTFEICEICFWEDDNIQYEDPKYKGGANKISLLNARSNFELFGAMSKEFIPQTREPKESDTRLKR